MVHCDLCCLRMSLNKDKTLPKHYTEAIEGVIFTYGQKECSASGTTRYTPDKQFRGKCQRPRSKRTCPDCGTKPLTLNKNGKYPKHPAPDGGKCAMSEANYPRR